MSNNNFVYRSRDVVWAFFLIFIGTMFLLNSTGVVGWGIWTYVFSFWPVFLILGGLKLIIGKSLVADIVLSVLALLIFVFVGVYSYIAYTGSPVNFLPERVNQFITRDSRFMWNNEHRREHELVIEANQYENIESREINLNIGASYFQFIDSDMEDFFEVTADYPSNFREPVLTSSERNNNLLITFRSASPRMFHRWSMNEPRYEITAGRVDIPTSVNIELGAGKGDIDLLNLGLQSLTTKVGAGQLAIILAQESIPQGDINIEVGAGQVTLNLPSGTAFELDYELGIGQISSNGQDIGTFIGSENGYRSDNYDEAEFRVKIVAKVGVGSLSININ
jgi:predicted membrane protein